MTITTTTLRAQYNGNGVTTSFAVPFEFLEGSTLKVILTDEDGVDTTQTITTHYTVTGGGTVQPDDGSVVMVTAPATGEKLTILRAQPLTQAASYTEQGPFPAKAHEKALDRLDMQVQMVSERVNRAMKLKETSANSDLTFPEPSADEVVGWNAAGTALENKALSDLGNLVEDSDDITQGVTNLFMTTAERAKVGHLTVTQAVDLDAMETKLAGIETGADVTDAANVAAAGAVMESDTSTAAMQFVIDEDSMASDSATKVPTQQSVKAYADNKPFNEVALSAAANATTNAATLQAAIDAATDTTLYLPAGDFEMNAVTLKPGVALRGRGKHATRLLCGSNSITILGYTAATSIKENFSIRDIGFEVNSKTGATAISLDGDSSGIRISRVTLGNIEIQGTFAQGVDLRFCANSNLMDVFVSQAVDAFVLDNVADTDLLGCKAQNGTGIGFKIVGGAGAFDEGIRMACCSTNGQETGIQIDGQDWGLASACSFTTCADGALITLNTVNNWKFSACDFAVGGGTPASANVVLSSGSSGFSFTGCQFILGTFGAIFRGDNHTIAGNYFLANSNVDCYLDGVTDSTIVGNQMSSTTVAWSILEAGSADDNFVSGNQVSGLTVLIGTSSVGMNQATDQLFSENAGGPGVIPAIQMALQSADRAGTDGSTAQAVFAAAQDTFTLLNAKTYEFEAEYFITRAAGTTSHTTGVLFGGTVTVSSIRYTARVSNPTGNVLGAVSEIVGEALTETVLTAANTSATENLRLVLKGRFRTSAAGTLIPQFKYSAAPGGAPTIKANSCFKIWQVGASSVVGIGNVA